MVAVEFGSGGVAVRGMAGLPSLTRPDRKEQYFFVNRRPTTAAVLNHCLREAYHTLIPHGRNPVVFVFIELDPGQVDVNVHPAKKEVRFRNSAAVRDAVIDGLRSALKQCRPVAPAGEDAADIDLQQATQQQAQFHNEDLPQTGAFKYPSSRAEACS